MPHPATASEARFDDRRAAGTALGRALVRIFDTGPVSPSLLVLALPRGGVPVAYEVVAALRDGGYEAQLDVFVVRKLGVPGQEELAMGAIASGGVRVLNEDVVAQLEIGSATIAEVERREARELARREALYLGDADPASLRSHASQTRRAAHAIADRTVVLVDDGLATGATMRAAVHAVRARGARTIVVAVPVGSVEACRDLGAEADAVVCLRVPEPFVGVGLWYADFAQTTDDEVRALLRAAAPSLGPKAAATGTTRRWERS
jgi:predicted phosphoribosyltransferase